MPGANLDPSWLNLKFSLDLTIRVMSLFFVSSLCVILNRVFLHDDTLH